MAEPSKPKYPEYGRQRERASWRLPNLEMPRIYPMTKDKNKIVTKMKTHDDRKKLINKLESFFSSVDTFRSLKG